MFRLVMVFARTFLLLLIGTEGRLTFRTRMYADVLPEENVPNPELSCPPTGAPVPYPGCMCDDEEPFWHPESPKGKYLKDVMPGHAGRHYRAYVAQPGPLVMPEEVRGKPCHGASSVEVFRMFSIVSSSEQIYGDREDTHDKRKWSLTQSSKKASIVRTVNCEQSHYKLERIRTGEFRASACNRVEYLILISL